jgi:Ca2+/Na+ antiporter
MKTWKLVSGILSMVLFVFVAFQSCAAGLSNTLSDNGEVSGSAGILVAILMLAGGIVSVATRKKGKKGGNIALIVLFGLAALIGFTNYGSYSDLAIWSGWCLINAVVAVIALIGKKKTDDV